MAAKICVQGLILSSYPYLRSAMVRFPLASMKSCKDCIFQLFFICTPKDNIFAENCNNLAENLKKTSSAKLIEFTFYNSGFSQTRFFLFHVVHQGSATSLSSTTLVSFVSFVSLVSSLSVVSLVV